MSPKQTRELAKRRGPKTTAGKLAVSRNAAKHGILSPRPVVAAFETERAWKAHREAIIESLAPWAAWRRPWPSASRSTSGGSTA